MWVPVFLCRTGVPVCPASPGPQALAPCRLPLLCLSSATVSSPACLGRGPAALPGRPPWLPLCGSGLAPPPAPPRARPLICCGRRGWAPRTDGSPSAPTEASPGPEQRIPPAEGMGVGRPSRYVPPVRSPGSESGSHPPPLALASAPKSPTPSLLFPLSDRFQTQNSLPTPLPRPPPVQCPPGPSTSPLPAPFHCLPPHRTTRPLVPSLPPSADSTLPVFPFPKTRSRLCPMAPHLPASFLSPSLGTSAPLGSCDPDGVSASRQSLPPAGCPHPTGEWGAEGGQPGSQGACESAALGWGRGSSAPD